MQLHAGVYSLGRVERAIEPLLQRFNRTLDTRVADALLAIDAGRAAPRLLAMFGAVCSAVQRLNVLSGEKQTIDCTRQADRQRARAHWSSLVSREAR